MGRLTAGRGDAFDGGGASKLRVRAGEQWGGVGGFGQGIREINDGVSLCEMRRGGRL